MSILLLLLSRASAAAAQSPDDEQFTVIKAGRIITAAGDDITDGEIVIVDGKVRLVGRKLDYPKSARMIDARTQTVMPGLIHLHARPGLPGYTRTGVHGDLKAADEVYLSELDLDDFVQGGFTTACIYPAGVGIPGLASVYRTAGPDSRLLTPAAYLRVTMREHPRDKHTLRDALKKAKAEIEKVDKARKEWETKQKEAAAKKQPEAQPKPDSPAPAPAPPTPPKPGTADQPASVPPAPPTPSVPPVAPVPPPAPEEFKPPEIDAAHRPLVDLVQKTDGAAPLLLELARASDLLHALDVLASYEAVRRMFYLIPQAGFGGGFGGGGGGSDFNYSVSKLGEFKVMVVLAPQMQRLPNTITRYNLAGELALAGAEIALVPDGDGREDLGAFRARVADLCKSGLRRPDAIRAMTVNAAKVLGLDKRIGSIEKGKDADLIFLDGDVLDPGARVMRVMVLGETVWERGKKP